MSLASHWISSSKPAMRVLKRFLFLSAMGLASPAYAIGDIVVVVDAKSDVVRLSREDVINIFLGRHRNLPNGSTAIPVDQPLAGEVRSEFYRKLVDKEPSEINAYWARLVFSGKTSPPLQASSASEVLAQVVTRPGGIGYMDRNQVDARVKVVLEFKP